jgi:hypothetical protein
MRLALRSLAWEGDGKVAVALDDREAGEAVTAVATVGDGEGRPVLAVEPDVFATCDGTAEDVRRVVAAIRAFAVAATPPG